MAGLPTLQTQPVKTQFSEQQRQVRAPLLCAGQMMLEELALSEPLLRMILTHFKPREKQHVEFACIEIKDFCSIKNTIKVLNEWITDQGNIL